jgi:solute carrier family 25 iron transporter 28/37
VAKILYKDEGILRFWKGANVIASGCIPAHGAQFVSYEILKEKVNFKNQRFDLLQTMGIGAATTFAHDFFITPADIVKQRLQLCKSLTASQCISNIIQSEGVKGLWRSYPLTVFMNIPYASIVVCVNENLKTLIRPWETQNPHFWYIFCAGVAGGAAGVITNPFDVVKTKIQT